MSSWFYSEFVSSETSFERVWQPFQQERRRCQETKLLLLEQCTQKSSIRVLSREVLCGGKPGTLRFLLSRECCSFFSHRNLNEATFTEKMRLGRRLKRRISASWRQLDRFGLLSGAMKGPLAERGPWRRRWDDGTVLGSPWGESVRGPHPMTADFQGGVQGIGPEVGE